MPRTPYAPSTSSSVGWVGIILISILFPPLLFVTIPWLIKTEQDRKRMHCQAILLEQQVEINKAIRAW